METMTYEALASCIYPYTEGLAPAQLAPVCRTGVREVCRDTKLLADISEHDWRDDGVYRLDHAGYEFNEIGGVWVDKHQELGSRLDPSFSSRTRIYEGYTLMLFPDPEYYGSLFPDRLDRKLTIRFSMMPRVDSQDFPALIYGQNERLVQVAVLKNLGAFIKEGNRRTSYGATYKREYDELLRGVKLRNAQNAFGPRQVVSTLNDSFTIRGFERRWGRGY